MGDAVGMLVAVQLRTLLTKNHGLLQHEMLQVESKNVTHGDSVFIRGPETQALLTPEDEQYTLVSLWSQTRGLRH